jgi:hypothetical protein
MKASVGILAYGSLIDNPGREIEAALVGRKPNVRTPFGVEFGRSSIKRGGAPGDANSSVLGETAVSLMNVLIQRHICRVEG